MSWFMRGVQSALFHYVSCAPCTGYMTRNKRRKQAKKDRKARHQLQMEQPELYHHPEPSATNPYWNEEITMGPGPPPRRARGRANTNNGTQRAIATAGTQSSAVSQGGSSIDVNGDRDLMRMSDDTLDDDNWNRKRYQREDEELWGADELPSPTARQGSSVGVVGVSRPGTSKSSAESWYTARVPPVNDLHPPVVSLPSPHAADNRWMLQPPPKASVMSGKERASNRSRSGSGASSRVELSLQRQVSVRQLKHKLERGETPDLSALPGGSSLTNLQHTLTGQRHDRPKTPLARPNSAASSRNSRRKKRRDTAHTRIEVEPPSSEESSDTVVHGVQRATTTPPPASTSLKVLRVRSSRKLSTVMSSGSGTTPPYANLSPLENEIPKKQTPPKRLRYSSTQSTDSIPRLLKHRSPLMASDVSSLNVLEDLVSPHALLNSRYVSAPLVEARIRLPPSDKYEEATLRAEKESAWTGSGFGISRGWGADNDGRRVDAPVPQRDPRNRWSVDF